MYVLRLYTQEYCLAIKKDRLESFVGKWIPSGHIAKQHKSDPEG